MRMKQRALTIFCALLFVGLVVESTPPLAAQADIGGIRGPIVRHDAHHGISPPLWSIPPVAPRAGSNMEADEADHHQPPIWLRPPSNGAVVDTALQTSSSSVLAATYGLNFEGIGAGFQNFNLSSAPPDTNGAIGATQYVQTVNASFAVFDKNTGAVLYGAADISTLFTSLTGSVCGVQGETDPVVLYDKLANRWLISVINASNSSKFAECIAVSTTSDATGTYALYEVQFGTTLPDYPKLGVWPDAYYYTSDAFPVSGNGYEAACAFDRAAMLAGQAMQSVCFQNPYFALMPSDMDGTTAPPSGEPNFFIGVGSSNGAANALVLFKFHVDFATTSNSTFTGPVTIPVASYNPMCNNSNAGQCVPQYGTTQKLDSLNFTPMFRLAYRNFGSHESLVATHSVDAGSSGGVRWYEIQDPNGTSGGPTLYQQGTWAPDSNWRWMGSVAMDSAGDIAAGYSISSGAMHPAIAVTGRTPSDALGTLETETVIFDGPGSQTPTLNRWGDYSAITVDPVDDCTFWYTTEYIPSPNGAFNWHTRIASFRMDNCVPASTAADFTISPSPDTVSITPGNSGTSTLTIAPLNSFNSTVNLTAAVTGGPAGVTASLNPTSVTGGSGTSTLTINTTNASPGGNFTIAVTATGGGLTHTAYVTVALPGFSIATSGTGNISVNQGGAANNTITVNSFNGFTGTVNLSATGVPAGVTAVFSPNPAATSSTLTLTASSSAATTAPVAVTISGTSGALMQTATLNVAVSAATGTGGSGTPIDLTSAFNLNGIYVDGTKYSTTGGLDGVGFSYSSNLLTPNRILSGVQFTFGTADSTSVTTPNAWYGNGTALTLPAAQQAQYTTMQMLATGIEGNQTSQTLTVTYTDNSTTQFTQNFSDWYTPQNYLGEVEAVAMPYRDSSDGSQDNRPFNLYGYSFALNSAKTAKSLTLPNNRDVVVLAVTMTGAPATPGYSLTGGTANPTNVNAGSSSTATVTVTPANGYTGSVTLSCSISPVVSGSGAPSCSLSPNPVVVTSGAATSMLTFTTVAPGGNSAKRFASAQPITMTRPRWNLWYTSAIFVPGLGLMFFSFACVGARRKTLLGFSVFCIVAACVILPACGGGSSGGGGGGGCSSVPSVPTGLAASSTTSTGTTLNWTASTAASGCSVTGYTVYENGSAIASPATTTYNVTGLTASTQYSFSVSASDSSGASAQSAAINVTTLSAGTPSGPYTITITGKDASGVTQTGNPATVTVTVN